MINSYGLSSMLMRWQKFYLVKPNHPCEWLMPCYTIQNARIFRILSFLREVVKLNSYTSTFENARWINDPPQKRDHDCGSDPGYDPDALLTFQNARRLRILSLLGVVVIASTFWINDPPESEIMIAGQMPCSHLRTGGDSGSCLSSDR